ncbi:MAG: ATP-binding protein [Micropruina sp.]|nr:ATP-binding protein [Micropruina sp.]
MPGESPVARPLRGVTTSGLSVWMNRAITATCMASLIPALFMGANQFDHLHPLWLAVIGGSIIALSLLMPVYAWLEGPFHILAGLYAGIVLIGVVTWPWGWQQGLVNPGSPWIWMCVGVAAFCSAVAGGLRVGLIFAMVASLAFGGIRMTPSGGSASLIHAAQDSLTLLVLPSALIVVLHYRSALVQELDASVAASHRAEVDAALEQALTEERTRLDGIIHDQVMTTLVAAAQSSSAHDPHVAGLAARALATLSGPERAADAGPPVTAAQFTRLIKDIVESVCAIARVRLTRNDPALRISQLVASTLGQAVREATLNAERHADATAVEVDVAATAEGGTSGLTIEIADDGRGFDPGRVPEARLGIRVSLIQRMETIGGRADVVSAPGKGSRVTLSWRGPDAVEDQDSAGLMSAVQPTLFGYLVWGLVAAQIFIGWTALSEVTSIWPVLIAQLVAIAAAGLALSGTDRAGLSLPAALGVLGLLATMTALVHSVLPPGVWPGYATWHSSVVMVLLITLLVRQQRWVAWSGALIFTGQVVVWALQGGLGATEIVRVLFGTLLWLGLASLILRGLRSVGDQLAALKQATQESTKHLAASFSALVLREVWLTDIREQVAPMLSKVADPAHELTDDERRQCRVLEGRLRDGLRAGNLISRGVSDAIGAARSRGVDVTLVDNRGSRLPEPVRHATLRQLEELVNSTDGGRIVARAAPEGYPEAVTILSVAVGRGSRLTMIDEAGAISVRET